MSILYVVETNKTADQATLDLQEAVANHGFGVLHIHNLKETLNTKGIDFKNQCLILEICNPVQAAKVLGANMALNTALPCRVSVYEEEGKTKIGMIKPTALLGVLSDSEELKHVAEDVESKIIRMIDEACN